MDFSKFYPHHSAEAQAHIILTYGHLTPTATSGHREDVSAWAMQEMGGLAWNWVGSAKTVEVCEEATETSTLRVRSTVRVVSGVRAGVAWSAHHPTAATMTVERPDMDCAFPCGTFLRTNVMTTIGVFPIKRLKNSYPQPIGSCEVWDQQPGVRSPCEVGRKQKTSASDKAVSLIGIPCETNGYGWEYVARRAEVFIGSYDLGEIFHRKFDATGKFGKHCLSDGSQRSGAFEQELGSQKLPDSPSIWLVVMLMTHRISMMNVEMMWELQLKFWVLCSLARGASCPSKLRTQFGLSAKTGRMVDRLGSQNRLAGDNRSLRAEVDALRVTLAWTSQPTSSPSTTLTQTEAMDGRPREVFAFSKSAEQFPDAQLGCGYFGLKGHPVIAAEVRNQRHTVKESISFENVVKLVDLPRRWDSIGKEFITRLVPHIAASLMSVDLDISLQDTVRYSTQFGIFSVL
ncbi:hypothetical protein B0H14DRAFT_2557491 [Mycena olivaceomarginata]|nr:hypothetical protein B0H14DRAFT_2557491 [Mycena olivaceomarginata]